MIVFLVGVVIFFGVHLLPMVPALQPARQALVRRFGAGPYQGLFSLVAVAGLVLVVVGYGRIETTVFWFAPAWGWTLNPPLMVVATVLAIAAYLPGNIKRFTRHPFLWAVIVWAIAHWLVTGTLAAVLLFGLFAVFAGLAMISANLRGATLQQARKPWYLDVAAVAAGLVGYVTIVWLHGWLGVPVV